MVYQLGAIQPTLSPDVYLAPNSAVIGDVTLGKQVSIWFGAVLRGDVAAIQIGEGSNIQDNSTVHTDHGEPCLVGRNVTIGHNVILHSCQIADNVIIGMGSTILNQAKIGKNCIVGANALVTRSLPQVEGCLIMGQPAKVVRELTADEIVHIATNAQHYVDNALRYRQQLTNVENLG